MTKYDLFRKRIAPVAFLAAIGFIAYDTCDKNERTHATFVLDFGTAEPEVRSVEAEVWMNGEKVSGFRRAALDGMYIGAARFDGSLPDTHGELRIDVELGKGEHRQITRAIDIQEGATVSVNLERDLR